MPTIQLHANKFEELIYRRGRPVRWQEAIICTCWNMSSGQPSFNCKACKGTGYVYSDPYDGIALVMSVTANKNFEQFGGVDIGDAIMTVPKRYPVILPNGTMDRASFTENPMFDIGIFDLITLLDDSYKTSEHLIKDIPYGNRSADTLSNYYITGIKSIQQMDPQTGTIKTYKKDIDYELEDNKIKWIGDQPSPGSTYSVVYYHRPTYSIYTMLPKPRHQDKQDLPKYAVLKYMMSGFIGGDGK